MPPSPAQRAASLAKRQRTCDICGTHFIAKKARQKSICSPECNLERNRRFQREQSERARLAWVKTCPTCGKEHMATRAHSHGYCSRECQQVLLNSAHIGRKHSDEERRKRVESRKAFYAANPDAQKRRIESVVAATRTDEYRQKALERYEVMLREGRGICSSEIRAFTAARAQWVMRKVREELEADTAFVELWRETRERVMADLPYEGPGDWIDYNAYMREVGKRMTADPALRALQDNFCREAIPKWSRAYSDAEETNP